LGISVRSCRLPQILQAGDCLHNAISNPDTLPNAKAVDVDLSCHCFRETYSCICGEKRLVGRLRWGADREFAASRSGLDVPPGVRRHCPVTKGEADSIVPNAKMLTPMIVK
jgi:hypothetical protein